jgi:hypothetical protein
LRPGGSQRASGLFVFEALPGLTGSCARLKAVAPYAKATKPAGRRRQETVTLDGAPATADPCLMQRKRIGGGFREVQDAVGEDA